jgi:superoxide reductase
MALCNFALIDIKQKKENIMSQLGEMIQSANWKEEKHVPVIESPDNVNKDEMFQVKASLGKEIAHPNTTEHHIRWIQLYFKPEGEKSTYHIGSFEFTAHGESVDGANKGPVYTNHTVIAELKTSKPGRLVAASYCNIHGMWESYKDIQVQ